MGLDIASEIRGDLFDDRRNSTEGKGERNNGRTLRQYLALGSNEKQQVETDNIYNLLRTKNLVEENQGGLWGKTHNYT